MTSKNENQLTCMAGEFLTVAKLFKRHYQASVTFGNAKAIDVLAYNPRTDKTFVVQVKTLRQRNCFDLDGNALKASHVYVFVVLNDFETAEEFFVMPGADILADVAKFFGSSCASSRPTINYGPLKPYRDNWKFFDL